MKKSILLLVTLLASSFSFATSTPAGFTDDLDAAQAIAKEQNKLVYVVFSGSDWCGWCIKLEEEVFSKAEFAPAVKDDYELVFIDSPRDKSRLSENAKAKNPGLTKKFNIRGFPSYVVLKPDGSELMRGSAYRSGGLEGYVDFLKVLAKDPDQILRVKRLKAEWVDPLERQFMTLMKELNAACGKYMDEQAAKPENKAAGKTRDDFRDDCINVVKQHLPKFRALADKARDKAKEAPEEIASAVGDYAASVDKWIQMIEGK